LRVLCLQEDVADRVLEMLEGAMRELALGDPERLATDVGPVIDEAARAMLVAYIDKMRSRGFTVHQIAGHDEAGKRGTFVPPTIIEINTISDLEREVFGPVLHVLRFGRDDLDRVVDGINGLEYGLTLGVHSRVDETIDRIVERARVGNIYVNRNVVGAVVGVQPFGGEGLSGTGPKAGGPFYLYRMLARFPPDAAIEELRALDESGLRSSLKAFQPMLAPFEALRAWARTSAPQLALFCDRLAAYSPAGANVLLPGPTGERNSYATLPRRTVLCVANDDRDQMTQLAAVLSVGSRAAWVVSDRASRLARMLPDAVSQSIETVKSDVGAAESRFDAVLFHGSPDECRSLLRRLAERPGPLVSLHAFSPGEEPLALERLLNERVVSVNTAAAGGNASLMTIG
jgi:RHH-type proline utilization regulon transcriptional repressor/proline dehydrogenase/delta 1-pyrroline-5-carboxylate dehydrogenase